MLTIQKSLAKNKLKIRKMKRENRCEKNNVLGKVSTSLRMELINTYNQVDKLVTSPVRLRRNTYTRHLEENLKKSFLSHWHFLG